MQTFKHVKSLSNENTTISNEDVNDKILKVISDNYSRQIMALTVNESKSAAVLSAEAMIPISTVYRRLQDLIDVKFLRISGSITDDGKKLFLYKCKIKEIYSIVNGSDIKIQLRYVEDFDQNL
jgi:hypothetical protein